MKERFFVVVAGKKLRGNSKGKWTKSTENDNNAFPQLIFLSQAASFYRKVGKRLNYVQKCSYMEKLVDF